MRGPDLTKLVAVVAALAAIHAGCAASKPLSGIAPAGQAGDGSAGAAAGQGGHETGAAGEIQDAAADDADPAADSMAAGTGGSAGATGTDAGATGTDAGAAGGNAGGPGGTGGGAGTGGPRAPTTKNYQLTGTWPDLKAEFATKPGNLTYKKILIHNQFLAESCAIGDYDNDGIPDVSSGRIWYQGTNDPATTFTMTHPFRSGHGPLPRDGAGPEIDTGVSDDWSDFAWDVNGDGFADIINIAQTDVDEVTKTNPKIGTVQRHATAYWYQNPGTAALAATPDAMWTPHLMHADVRHTQHGVVDMNGDGFPEVYGSCKSCNTTKGYYQGNPAALETDPNPPFTFHPVSASVTFPFGGTGWLHGIGAGDINGDGKPDLLSREGAWLQGPNGTWSATTTCTPGGALPCFIKTAFYDSSVGGDQIGPSHMYGADMDKDGCTDVVAAGWAHGDKGLDWYQQQKNGATCGMTFKKFRFMGAVSAADVALWGAGFTEPMSLQVVDMDGDGRPDVISGKMRFAHPNGYGDPDLLGTPYVYVFQNVGTPDARNGGPITLKPMKVDGDPTKAAGTPEGGMGVGRQIGIGHVNADGIVDICVATKIGLAVFLGQ